MVSAAGRVTGLHAVKPEPTTTESAALEGPLSFRASRKAMNSAETHRKGLLETQIAACDDARVVMEGAGHRGTQGWITGDTERQI